MKKRANWECAIKRFLCAFGYLIFGIVLTMQFDCYQMIKPEFGQHALIYKLGFLLGSLHGILWCYISFLVIGESNMLAAGFGYRVDANGVESYDNFVSMNVKNFALARDVSDFTTNWNVQVHYWLKYYVMLRVMDRSQKRGVYQGKAAFWTFFTSALWHGTYPGLFIFFLSCAGSEQICRNFAKVTIISKLRRTVIPYSFEQVFLWFWAFLTNGFFALGFFYFTLDPYLKFVRNFDYIPFFVWLAALVFAMLMPKEKRNKEKSN